MRLDPGGVHAFFYAGGGSARVSTPTWRASVWVLRLLIGGIAIVNSGCGGARLGRGDGGAIPRERVRKLAAGRRSVRRRRRARARR